MSDYKHCCECNERTGRAGPSDDSLYLGSVGPFCEDCVDAWPDKMTEEYGRLMAMNAELTEEIGYLEDLIIKLGQMLREIVNITKGPPEENSWHSTHDAVESVERLQARVADLEQAASVPEWIKCSERMPTVNDADFDGYVWWARFNHVARTKQRIVVDGLEHLDDAFWMPTNLTLTQPQPPKQEQGHE